jgi:hypothetical protein
MGLTPTLILAGTLLAMTVLCGWRGAMPLKTILKPRMVPWRLFMLLSFMAWMVVMAHLVTLIKPSGS